MKAIPMTRGTIKVESLNSPSGKHLRCRDPDDVSYVRPRVRVVFFPSNLLAIDLSVTVTHGPETWHRRCRDRAERKRRKITTSIAWPKL
jgi:hypothetical protein